MQRSTIARRVVGLALLTVLLVAASAQAATPAVPIVQLRVTGGPKCTATPVSARFVLTAAHCARRHGRTASLSSLRVYSRARTRQFAKVAAVAYAPRSAGRRPDVALLQLTSGSTARVARLPDRRLVPRGGTAAKVAGWTAKRSRGRTARLTSARGCGRGTARAALCGRLRGALPSVRCRDAAGAALTVRRNGKTVLLGIGGVSPRGCRRSPSVRFANISDDKLRAWISDAIDPGGSGGSGGGGQPGGSGQPGGGGAAPTPASFLGSWLGRISEDLPEHRSYPTKVTIDRDGSAGDTVGSTDYAGGLCGGKLIFQGGTADGSIKLLERLTVGASGCIDGGTITLAHILATPAISYSWVGATGEGRSSGVLNRQP